MEVKNVDLEILEVSFSREFKWCFKHGELEFYAPINDIGFLHKMAADNIPFGCKDRLICDLQATNAETENGTEIKFAVTKVIEHVQGKQ